MFMNENDMFQDSSPAKTKKPGLSLDTDVEDAINKAPTTPAERRKKLMEQKKQAMLDRKKRQLSSSKLSFKDDDDRLSRTMSPRGTASSPNGSIFDGRAPETPTQTDMSEFIKERSDQAAISPTTGKALTSSEKNLMAAGIKPIFDPSPKTTTPAPVDISDVRTFINSPVQPGHTIECLIVRNKRGMKGKMYPVYELYVENPKKLLLCAKKRTKNKTSNYLISMDRNQLDKDSTAYMGKVRSNFVGTEFTMYDRGMNPKKLGEEGSSDRSVREELGAILYESNILGSKGPRRMTVVIPAVDPTSGKRDVIRPRHPSQCIAARIKSADTSELEGLQTLVNKDPQWNEALNAYVLDFRSRVTMASVKNFQLIDEQQDENDVILQFGRVAKENFTMDVSFPLSPLQAFSICLTSFDYKLALE